MQSVLGSAAKQAGETAAAAVSSNKKLSDLKANTRQPTEKDFLTSDFGVKENSHDIWLHASTGDRQGPALLEDNFGREKVRMPIANLRTVVSHMADYEIRS